MTSFIIIDIIVTIVFSIAIIIALHYGWNYIKDNFSTKRTKHLVNAQIEKYKKIAHEISQSIPSNDYISNDEKQNMNDELTAFMNEQ